MPTTLFGRSLLIIVLPVAIMQIAVTYVFFDAHWQTVTSRLSEGLAGDIAWAVESYQDDPSAGGLRQALPTGPSDSHGPLHRPAAGRELPHANAPLLAVRAHRPVAAAARWPTGWTSPSGSTPPATRPTSTSAWRCRAGCCASWRPRDRAFATQGHIFVLWMTVATVLLTAVAILFIRNQVRAIERLADAAEAFGRGGDVPGLQAARRARGAPGGRRLPRHERAHPAPHRPAHHPAGLGQPRPAHAAHPAEAGAGAGRALPRATRR